MIEGLIQLPWWGYVIVAVVFTQITIAGVTLYLHRCQTHRALDLHPIISHFFRFWLWLTTSMITREWVAVHRKHHAKVETDDDPHSPQVHGIAKVLWLGAWLYHKEIANQETLDKYGGGTPDDWLERRVYTGRHNLGILSMLIINVLLFGAVAGAAIWVVQMAWIPFWAAGVINGVGHYWGYRNFEVPDASKNIVPWGLIIGGEELHNNHHAYASSARFSNKKWEIDIGWLYIRLLSGLGLAKVRRTVPELVEVEEKQQFDLESVRALVNTRFQIMANFVSDVLHDVHRQEVRKLANSGNAAHVPLVKRARRLMTRESRLLSARASAQLSYVLKISPRLNKVYLMKQRLQEIWSSHAQSQEKLLQALEDWCRAAEASGIEALRDFSRRLRRYELAASA
ncbi:MAG: fatty acid desaturase [Gammaproteobacteria bacterium]|nr:fatty acid desaturase [Gammaproteobacteria bacterium]